MSLSEKDMRYMMLSVDFFMSTRGNHNVLPIVNILFYVDTDRAHFHPTGMSNTGLKHIPHE